MKEIFAARQQQSAGDVTPATGLKPAAVCNLIRDNDAKPIRQTKWEQLLSSNASTRQARCAEWRDAICKGGVDAAKIFVGEKHWGLPLRPQA